MPIISKDPEQVPEQVVPAVSLDRWWLPEFRITAQHPAFNVKLHATLRKYGIDSLGQPRLAEQTAARLELCDLFAVALVDNEAGALLEAVTAKVVQVAAARSAFNEAHQGCTLPEGVAADSEEAEALRQAAGLSAAELVWPFYAALQGSIKLSGVVK